MKRFAIVENEIEQAELLKQHILRYSHEKNEFCEALIFSNGIDFLSEYSSDISAVFLDIQMPFMDGMEVAERLRKIDSTVPIVFVTNMAQYAIQGYKVSALDFLVKPVSYFSFATELDKIIRLINGRRERSLWVVSMGKRVKLLFSEIRFVEIIRHDICIHTEKETLTYRGTLKEIEAKLKESYFSRPDNCYIVNMNYISSIEKDDIFLESGDRLHISRSRRKEFFDAFNAFINRS